MKGFVELPNAREVKETEKAVLLDLGDKKQSWFPKKAIGREGNKYFVAIWFNKKVQGVETPTKTELVNKFEKKRHIEVQQEQEQGQGNLFSDKADSLLKASESVVRWYTEYRKGTANSGVSLSKAIDDLSHWINETKKSGKVETPAPAPAEA